MLNKHKKTLSKINAKPWGYAITVISESTGGANRHLKGRMVG